MLPFLTPLRRCAFGTAALLACYHGTLAQNQPYRPGYVVLAAEPTDTLRGNVDLRRVGQPQPLVVFQAAPTAPPRTYGLNELLAAGETPGQLWRRVVVPQGAANVPALLQVLVSGAASLYADRTGRLPATYYLDKPGRSAMPLQPKQFAQVLQTTFADCPTVNTQVALAGRYVYAAADLRRYVVNYNRCVYPRVPVQMPTDPPKPVRLHWEAQAGVAQLQFFYPYLLRRRAHAGPLTPTGGAFAWLELNRHLGLTAGFTLSSLRSDNTVSQLTENGYVQTMRYQTKGSLLRLPINVRYALRPAEASWRPYVQVGGHFSQIIRGRMHWQNSYTGSGVPLPPQEFDVYYEGIGRGVQAETGVLIRYHRHHVGAGLRYEQTFGFPNTGRSFLIDFNQLGVMLTYTH